MRSIITSSGGWAQPIVADGAVYVIHNRSRSGQPNVRTLTVYDFESGALLWEHNFTAENRTPRGSATVDENTVYVYTTSGSFDVPDPPVGTVYSFNVVDGSVIWSKDIPLTLGLLDGTIGVEMAPVVANGSVYVAGQLREQNPVYTNAGVYALDAATGTVVWYWVIGEKNEHEKFSKLAFADGLLFVALSDQDEPHSNEYTKSVLAINASSGGLEWINSSLEVAVHQEIVVRNEHVYVIDKTRNEDGNVASELVALHVLDGSEQWRFTPPNVVILGDGV